MLGLTFSDFPWNSSESNAEASNVEAGQDAKNAALEKRNAQTYKQRGHAMAKLLNNSQDARLKHVEELCAKQTEAIARLQEDFQQSSILLGDGGQSDTTRIWAEVSNLTTDIRLLQKSQVDVSRLAVEVRQLKEEQSVLSEVPESIRRLEELQVSQMQADDRIECKSNGRPVEIASAQLVSLRNEINDLRAFVEKGFEKLSDKHLTEVGDLKHNMQHLRDMQEYVAVKSGFLALGASDCSHSEKEALFSALQDKEKKLSLQGDYSKSLDRPVSSSPLLVLKEISVMVDEVAVTLNRSRGQPLGVAVVPNEDNKSLLIEWINDGILKEWNAANTSRQIHAGSSIVSVNGIRQDAKRMIDELSNNPLLKILVKGALG